GGSGPWMINCRAPYDSNAVSIFDAAAKGDLSDLAKILKKNNINAVNASDKTLLHIAAANGHVAIIEYLINKGAKLDVKDKKGRTPMHRAAEKGQDDAVKVLLQAGAYIYSLDKEAKTPLHLAAQNHHTHILKRILKEEARCYKDQQNFLHMATALGYAISQGFDKTVKVLLEAGANKQSKTPLHLAAEKGDHAMVELLLSFNADPNAMDKEKKTPLHTAAMGGHLNTVKVLLAQKPSPSLPSSPGYLPRSLSPPSPGYLPLSPPPPGICSSLPLTLGNRSSFSPCLPLHPRPAPLSGGRGRYTLKKRRGWKENQGRAA
uniref:Uncharacterized protein n=1 Tax=Gopherus agassizii TaxID=38772 RepID=A0A452HI83_9SAUR